MVHDLRRVVLISTWSRNGLLTIWSLRVLGVCDILLITDQFSHSLTYARNTTSLLKVKSISTANPSEVESVINEEHGLVPIDIVIGSDYDSLVLVGKMRERLKPNIFPMASLETVEMLNDKWHFYELCQKLGLGAPRSLRARLPSFDMMGIGEVMGFPLVIKPTRSYGQRGILFIKNDEELTRSFVPSTYGHDEVIVQQYIEGADWGMSVMAQDGQITHYVTFSCPDFHTAEFRGNDKLFKSVKSIVRATNFTGVANFDARQDKNENMWLFECNPRFFIRMRASQLKGLDFVLAGVCPELARRYITRGHYYPWRHVLTSEGRKALRSGMWPHKDLVQELRDLALDIIPILLRRYWREEDTRR
jgi:hypothetical protein